LIANDQLLVTKNAEKLATKHTIVWIYTREELGHNVDFSKGLQFAGMAEKMKF
jgi:hypothetical protein